jgi:lysophospholipase L1-like esterase
MALPKLSDRLQGNINNIWTRHWKNEFVTGISSDFTYATIAKAPCSEFTHVRIILKNKEASPPTVTRFIGAVTNTATNTGEKVVPSVGNTLTEDSTTGWVTFNFSGSPTPTLPAGYSDSKDPGVLFSDWMPIQSIAPVDGTTLPYIMVRGYFTSGGTYTCLTQGLNNTNQSQANYIEVFTQAGDKVSTPSGMTTGSAQNKNILFGIEFKSSSAVVKVMIVGDSITQGQHTGVGGNDSLDGTMRSWGVVGGEQLRAQYNAPVNIINYGHAGATTTSYSTFGKKAIANHLPTICFYSIYSPNDNSGSIDQAKANVMFQTALDFAQYAYSQNCLPVFTFLAPNNNLSYTSDGFRQSLIRRAKAAGIRVCDMTTAMGDGATPERFLSGFNYDNVHPNDTGHAAMAKIFQSTVIDILSQNITW